MTSKDFDLNWDKEKDTVYLLRKGVRTPKLINIDSEKIPGIIKRIDPKTKECVGFIIECFSDLFPRNAKASEATIKELLILSISMTNEASKALEAA